MGKVKEYSITGAAILAPTALVLNYLKQSAQISKSPGKAIDWKEVLAAAVKGAAIGGGIGAILGGVRDFKNSKVQPINTDSHLSKLANNLQLNKNGAAYRFLDEKAQILISILTRRFKWQLATHPCKLGSTEKGTALKYKFDIDVALRFKSDSFKTTAEMYNDLHNFLETIVGQHGIIGIRTQKKSIGVLFDLGGKEKRIDLVPCKLTAGRTSGYLFVNQSGLFESGSYTKTDIGVLNRARYSKSQKKLILILKNWKIRNDLPLSSYLLERLVVEAYRCNFIVPKKLTMKVIMVLNHISRNLDGAIVRGVENRSNILNDISQEDKDKVTSACKKAIEEFQYQPNSILKTLNVSDPRN